ncbi:tetratricopeptide repeat protein [Nitrosopumilus sp.]|uniref:tetratricopeptide repeat protein n=1 Tax=Nitrosopumilus sp. TaxID=2024843 RepID=UPI0034A0448A
MSTVLSPLLFTDVFADSFTVNFDNSSYDLGDSLTVSGNILEISMPVIAMSIYDPDGKILSANNLEISSEKTFSKTISLDSPFYEKTGKYLIKFDYGQLSQNHYFVIESEVVESETLTDVFDEPEILLLYTEQKHYTDKDIIKIAGLISALDSPTVLIGIYDPFGMPAGFYFAPVDSNLEFSTSFLVKAGVNFRVDGIYSIKAHYAETEATSFFEYSEITQNDDTTQNPTNDTPKESTDDNSSIINDDTTQNPTNDTPKESSSENNSSIINTEKTNSDYNTPIKNNSEVIVKKINSLSDKEPEIISEKIAYPPKIKKQNNLTVEDIELGVLLNQINLKCDSSIYADTISYYDGMGPALYRLCKFDSSLNFFNESLSDNPYDVEILVNKGSTLGKLGYYSEAILYYDQAIHINPDFLPAKNNKANALAMLEHFDDAVLLYNEILEQNPNYSTAKNNLDIVLSKNSNFSNGSSESNIKNVDYSELSLSKKLTSQNLEITDANSEKLKPSNFLDEIGTVFSTLGSLFGFLN